VNAIVETKFFFQVEWDVLALFVLVSDDIMWARDYATSASST